MIQKFALVDVGRQERRHDASEFRRRTLLKTTEKVLFGLITIAVGSQPEPLWQEPLAAARWRGWPRLPWAKPHPPMPRMTRMRRPPTCSACARQAMAENNLAAADSLISQAEALDVQYGFFGDTPKKVRRDLEMQRAASAAATKPSQLLSPLGLDKNQQAPGTDPFAGRLDPPAGTADAGQVTPLPKVGVAGAMRSPQGQGSPLAAQRTHGRDFRRKRRFQPDVGPCEVFRNYRRQHGGLRNRWTDSPTGQRFCRAIKNNSPLRDARLALAVGDVPAPARSFSKPVPCK